MVNLRPTNGWDPLASLGHPCKFQRVSRLGSVTARYSGSGRQPNFAVLNRGRHLYSAGRPSRAALAHILVVMHFRSTVCHLILNLEVSCLPIYVCHCHTQNNLGSVISDVVNHATTRCGLALWCGTILLNAEADQNIMLLVASCRVSRWELDIWWKRCYCDMTSVSVVVVVVFLRLCVDYNSFRLHLSTTRLQCP